MRVARQSKDGSGDRFLLEGPGRDFSPRDEPLTASVARYHASWDTHHPEEDPLAVFGAVDGLLPDHSKEDSMWVRELIIRLSYPHTGNHWRNLPEAIEEVLGMVVTRKELRRISLPEAPDAIPMWGLDPAYLEQFAHVALAVTQCLHSFHSYLWAETSVFQLDPGWKLIRSLEVSENAPRLLITHGVWHERLRNAQHRLQRYLLALRGMWNESQRVRFPDIVSTISDIRSHQGSGGGSTEVGKYLQRSEY
ncbi:hypothetical protein BDZ89DRAFT_971860, partial [Hymenopellis radicata]